LTLAVLTSVREGGPCELFHSGQQLLGIDLHRRRSVIYRMTDQGDPSECVRISNDVEMLSTVMARARETPEVVLEATEGWYWAVDALQDPGANAPGTPAGSQGIRVPTPA